MKKGEKAPPPVSGPGERWRVAHLDGLRGGRPFGGKMHRAVEKRSCTLCSLFARRTGNGAEKEPLSSSGLPWTHWIVSLMTRLKRIPGEGTPCLTPRRMGGVRSLLRFKMEEDAPT
ncbi:hypothetical protein TNIN_490091 [Trichonephila inaurata madagascariensis]|uniref:Uncharacterized protein n=1 Tax=Trichonephila inaurata madagascariensis TaxID=2747483 RepID=A0A8X6JPG0_9ARAC|nr:hypothetical protein TNIN_490091 [Trichonephila inaurata madagascariensis]